MVGVNVDQGSFLSLSIDLIPNQQLSGIELRVVPELAPYVQVSPQSISDLAVNEPVSIVIDVIVGADVPVSSLDGVIQVRQVRDRGKGKNLAKPLPMRLNILRPRFTDPDSKYTVTYPPGTTVTDWTPELDPSGAIIDSTFFLVFPDDLDGVSINTLNVSIESYLASLSQTLIETARSELDVAGTTWQIAEHTNHSLTHDFVSAFAEIGGSNYQIVTLKGPQRLSVLVEEFLMSFEAIQ